MQSKFLPVFALLCLLFFQNNLFGQTPNLGAASTFALFTSSGAFDNVGPTTIVGDIGSNTDPVTGFPPGTVVGTIFSADPTTALVATDVASAYAFLNAQTCGAVLGVTLGGGQVLTPNIYCTGAATTLDGDLTLDAGGDPTAIFILQIDGALTTGPASHVLLINGAASCNVYWQVSGEFTVGNNATFIGTMLGGGAINLNPGSILFGRALTTAGAISTASNAVSLSQCGPPDVTCPANVNVSCASEVPVPDLHCFWN